MNEEEIKNWKSKIDSMTQEDMARAWRFSSTGNPIFISDILFEYFNAHFKSLGGFTPEISKRIGW